ncbi:hypothetical protein MPSEU_000162800 [Mayamaea pseudoterrestris]|nr:hypothetical protein MPSEU_000162800 [Mayamaea pseudoterrestris]
MTNIKLLVPLALSEVSLQLANGFQTHPFKLSHLGIRTFSTDAVSSSRLTRFSSIAQPTTPDATAALFTETPLNGETVQESSKNDAPLFEGFGKGIVRDYKARLPYYWSDFKDGLNGQSLAATLFLFFACLAPAIAFGGLFGAVTSGQIGTVEMIGSTAVCGMLYSLTAAQPLTIIGSTGPVLAFVACLAQLAQSMNLPFLPLYAWTGLWTSGILFVASLFSGSNLVKYLTRFTDEIFSTLISTIFVVEAVSDVGRTFTSTSSTLTKALETTTQERLLQQVDPQYSACIAQVAKTAYGAKVAALPTLSIPAVLGTTIGRPWLVPIFDLPVWARWAAVLPALMASVLLFLDQNITVRLINNPKWHMTKGRRQGNILDGMHADMLVLSVLTALQSLVGVPWLVAATVRSLSHVQALSKYDEHGKMVGTMEQRVTGFSVHSLIAGVILLPGPRQLLSQVPLSALMGLFMYLGVSSLPGNEMWERTLGFFKDRRLAPRERWSPIPTKVVRRFTYIQWACLALMCYVKQSRLIGVLFPVVIAGLAPLRYALERYGVVKKTYIEILDEE